MNPAMIAPVVALLIRHGLTAAGLVGLTTGNNIEMIAGGVVGALGLYWSYRNAKKNNA